MPPMKDQWVSLGKILDVKLLDCRGEAFNILATMTKSPSKVPELIHHLPSTCGSTFLLPPQVFLWFNRLKLYFCYFVICEVHPLYFLVVRVSFSSSLEIILSQPFCVAGEDFNVLKCFPPLKHSPSTWILPAVVLINDSCHCFHQFFLQTHRTEFVEHLTHLSDDFPKCWAMPWQQKNAKEGATESGV